MDPAAQLLAPLRAILCPLAHARGVGRLAPRTCNLPAIVCLVLFQVTTLPNGVRIASENTPGVSANIGIYVDAGSIYEGPGSHGISHLMQHMGFKATKNRQAVRLFPPPLFLHQPSSLLASLSLGRQVVVPRDPRG